MKQRLSARHQLCGAACGNQTAPAASMHVQKCQPKQATPCCAAHLHPALVVLVKAPGRHSIIAVSGHRVVDAGGAGGGRQAAGHGSGQQGRELVVAAQGCVCIAGGHAVVGALLLQLGLASTLVVPGGQPVGHGCITRGMGCRVGGLVMQMRLLARQHISDTAHLFPSQEGDIAARSAARLQVMGALSHQALFGR